MNDKEIELVISHGLELVEKIIKIVADARSGKTSPTEAKEKLAELNKKLDETHAKVAADQDAQDKALAEKFK